MSAALCVRTVFAAYCCCKTNTYTAYKHSYSSINSCAKASAATAAAACTSAAPRAISADATAATTATAALQIRLWIQLQPRLDAYPANRISFPVPLIVWCYLTLKLCTSICSRSVSRRSGSRQLPASLIHRFVGFFLLERLYVLRLFLHFRRCMQMPVGCSYSFSFYVSLVRLPPLLLQRWTRLFAVLQIASHSLGR